MALALAGFHPGLRTRVALGFFRVVSGTSTYKLALFVLFRVAAISLWQSRILVFGGNFEKKKCSVGTMHTVPL